MHRFAALNPHLLSFLPKQTHAAARQAAVKPTAAGIHGIGSIFIPERWDARPLYFAVII